MYENKYPEVDDVVMVQVKSIAEMGAYVSLLEYNQIEGMILLSELSRRRIRSITKLIKAGRLGRAGGRAADTDPLGHSHDMDPPTCRWGGKSPSWCCVSIKRRATSTCRRGVCRAKGRRPGMSHVPPKRPQSADPRRRVSPEDIQKCEDRYNKSKMVSSGRPDQFAAGWPTARVSLTMPPRVLRSTPSSATSRRRPGKIWR